MFKLIFRFVGLLIIQVIYPVMKKILLLLFILVLGCAIGATSASVQSDNVYICSGPKSTTYHRYSNCNGLTRCSTSISKISKEKAVNIGRRPCKICYK